MRKYLILIPILFFLALIQESFLHHFEIFGTVPNLVLISVFLLNFLQKQENQFGIFAGFFGGAILDLSSALPIGTFFLTLGTLSFFIKKMGKLFQKSSMLAVFLIFLFSFFFYKIPISFFSLSFNLESLLVEFLYNLALVFLLLVLIKRYASS